MRGEGSDISSSRAFFYSDPVQTVDTSFSATGCPRELYTPDILYQIFLTDRLSAKFHHSNQIRQVFPPNKCLTNLIDLITAEIWDPELQKLIFKTDNILSF